MTDQNRRTLADMTPIERCKCIGMWCAIDSDPFLNVIVRTYGEDTTYAQILTPSVNGYCTASLEEITPRSDLPRAWNPDGTPTSGFWEYDTKEFKGYIKGHERSITDRRWVGEWEAIE